MAKLMPDTTKKIYDVFIAGGGINGLGVALCIEFGYACFQQSIKEYKFSLSQ